MQVKPAKLSKMDFDVGCYFQQDGWVVEEKMDGIRCVLELGRNAVATGRRTNDWGRILPLAKQDVSRGWHRHLDGCVFDGELMADGRYFIWDILVDRHDNMRHMPLRQRKASLRALADWMPDHAVILPWFNTVRELGDFAEGVVWKHLDGDYRDYAWAKAKRTLTVDVTVVAYEGGGVALTVDHGRVQGVPADIQPGMMLECVAYGQWPSGKLKSGRFLRVRTDK